MPSGCGGVIPFHKKEHENMELVPHMTVYASRAGECIIVKPLTDPVGLKLVEFSWDGGTVTASAPMTGTTLAVLSSRFAPDCTFEDMLTKFLKLCDGEHAGSLSVNLGSCTVQSMLPGNIRVTPMMWRRTLRELYAQDMSAQEEAERKPVKKAALKKSGRVSKKPAARR